MSNYSRSFLDGTRETFVDHNDGTGTVERFNANGDLIQSETVTGLTIQLPQPLDATGALATLLVVDGVLSLGDAALAIHQPEQALTDEALAWGLGA
jgi:hypothetical protein